MRSEKIQGIHTPLYKQFQIFDKSVFLVFPFFSHIYTFSAILSLALRDLGFRSISASSGTITLLLTGRRVHLSDRKSPVRHALPLPVFIKFLMHTIFQRMVRKNLPVGRPAEVTLPTVPTTGADFPFLGLPLSIKPETTEPIPFFLLRLI